MAIDVTAYVLLEKDTKDQFIGGREVMSILELDEGHDRPVWQVRKAREKSALSKTLIPSKPENILFEGVEFLVACALGPKFNAKDLIDAGLKGYSLHLVLFDDSSCVEQVRSLSELGIKVFVFRQDSSAGSVSS